MNSNEKKPLLANIYDQTQEINLTEFLFHFLDHWKFIVISVIAAAIIAGVPTYLWAEKKYTTSAMVYILNPSDSVINLSDLQLSNYLAEDYLQIFKTHELNQMVADRLELPYSYQNIQSMVSITNVRDTRILKVQATARDPVEAALIANEMAECACDYIAEIMVTDRPTILSTALVPYFPSEPNIPATVSLAAGIGLIVSCAILVIVFLTDDKLKNAEAFTKVTGLPIYSEIPVIDMHRKTADRYYYTKSKSSSRHSGSDSSGELSHHHSEHDTESRSNQVTEQPQNQRLEKKPPIQAKVGFIQKPAAKAAVNTPQASEESEIQFSPIEFRDFSQRSNSNYKTSTAVWLGEAKSEQDKEKPKANAESKPTSTKNKLESQK